MSFLLLSPSTVAKLREIAASAKYQDEITRSETAVVVTLGLGPALYLTLDGRVLIHEYEDGLKPRVAETPEDIAPALVIAARKFGMPELLEYLPARPGNVPACEQCGGDRDVELTDVEGRPFRVVCHNCHGIGWRV